MCESCTYWPGGERNACKDMLQKRAFRQKPHQPKVYISQHPLNIYLLELLEKHIIVPSFFSEYLTDHCSIILFGISNGLNHRI